MVKFTFASAALILAALSSFTVASPVERRDVSSSKVASDLNQLSKYVTALQSEASSLGTGIAIVDALAINKHIKAAHNTLDNSAIDVAALQGASDSDAQTILAQVNSIAPNVVNVLDVTCAKKDVLMTLPFNMNKLTQERLSGLQNSADKFFDAMQSTFTQVDVGEVENIRNTVDSAFQNAIECYSY